MSGRILLVEDDRRVRRATALALSEEGYEVLEAENGDEGLRLLGDSPDMAILDVMLPGMDGYEVCRRIRKESDLPIIFVTAKSDTIDVVAGLESGADDYLTKPFAAQELVARVRALLRRVRAEARPPSRIVVEDVEIEPESGSVRKAGAPVSLTKTEFKLLCALAARPNQVYSREMLLENVWGYDYLGDSRLVDVHVRRLRAKIETDPANPTIVVTVRGLGYKLAGKS